MERVEEAKKRLELVHVTMEQGTHFPIPIPFMPLMPVVLKIEMGYDLLL